MTSLPAQSATESEPWRMGLAPHGLPLVGHALKLRRSPLQLLVEWQRMGDLVKLRMGRADAYFVCHPDLVHEVLVDAETFDKGGPIYDKARTLMGNGLVTTRFSGHPRQRRLVRPAFQRSRLPKYVETMARETAAEMDTWQPGGTIDFGEAMHAVTARATARALFEAELPDASVRRIQQALPVFTEGVYQRSVAPFGIAERLPLPATRRFNAARAAIESVIDEVIADHRRKDPDAGNAGLLAGDTDEGAPATTAELRDNMISVLLAGTETTAVSLSWAVHLLARHPETERRLHTEVDAVLGGGVPAFEDLRRLPYLQNTLMEALRLYPPVWMITRTTTADTTLGGRSLPAGTMVLASPYAIQRDPRHWTAPDRFDPERWTAPTAAPKNAMLPFLAGPRRCIGEATGFAEAAVALAVIAGRWRLRPAAEYGAPVPRATLVPGPLPMTVEPRHGPTGESDSAAPTDTRRGG